jgi:hypothetical protein
MEGKSCPVGGLPRGSALHCRSSTPVITVIAGVERADAWHLFLLLIGKTSLSTNRTRPTKP